MQLCTAGPTGFERYARLFHATADVADDRIQDCEGDLPTALLLPLLAVLGRHTGTPGDCFFALWDGYGGIPPAFLPGPRVRIPARSYLLFRGRLQDAGLWVPGEARGRTCPLNSPSPNLMWPQDRAWFVATEVDQPWTTIGGREALIEEILADAGLDAQPYRPSDHPPYRRE